MIKNRAQFKNEKMVSNHVLDFRGVKTLHEKKIVAARDEMRQMVLQKKSADCPTLRIIDRTTSTSTPSTYMQQVQRAISPVKTLSMLLIVLLSFASVFTVGPTSSYYSDDEESENLMSAGLVDFVLETTPFEDMGTTSINGTEIWEVEVTPHDESNPFYYYASSTNFHGSVPLCEVMDVIAILDGETMYEGPLMSLMSATTTNISEWTFEFSGAIGFPGEMCHFDIDFNGWQTRHNINEGGYSDTETVNYWILDPSVVINKVFFGNGSTTQDWVELYNPTDSPVDISNGFICDNNACDLLAGSTTVPAYGYVLIASSEDILNQIHVPSDVILIVVPDGMIGDGLEEEGDMLELRLSEGQPIDRLNWGEIDEGWINYTPLLWDPSLPAPEEGHVFTRMPIGIDTNMPEDFVEIMLPTVEILEPTNGSSWEMGEEVTIEWEAINLNGDDEDLQIDLYYIDAADTLHTIALDTPNDGEHDWTVIGEEQSSVEIEIVVTGPENILLNSAASTDITIACAEESTSSRCVGLILELEKKFSGVDLDFEPDQFAFHVFGNGIDSVVPHDGSILLPVGYYSITEVVPEGFDIPDWRIQWSGDTCEGNNTAGGEAWIEVEESDLRKVVSYCRADNQYRPDSRDRFREPHLRTSEVRGTSTSHIVATTTPEIPEIVDAESGTSSNEVLPEIETEDTSGTSSSSAIEEEQGTDSDSEPATPDEKEGESAKEEEQEESDETEPIEEEETEVEEDSKLEDEELEVDEPEKEEAAEEEEIEPEKEPEPAAESSEGS